MTTTPEEYAELFVKPYTLTGAAGEPPDTIMLVAPGVAAVEMAFDECFSWQSNLQAARTAIAAVIRFVQDANAESRRFSRQPTKAEPPAPPKQE